MTSVRFVLACLLAPLSATPSFAQTNTICEELRGRFADLSQSVGATAETRELSRAVVRQNLAIRRMWSDMRNQGCTADSSTVIVGGDGALCDRMQAAMDQMQDELDMLKDRREQSLSRAQAQGVDRRRLLAALEQNGCGAPASAVPDETVNNRFTPEAPQPEAYAPAEQPSGEKGSVTVIETPKPQTGIEPLQRQAPAGVPAAAMQPQPQQESQGRPYDPAARRVRQVGPQFLPSDQGSIDLRHPKADGPQPEE